MCVHFADPSSDCCSSFCHDAYSLSSSSFSHRYNSINTPMQRVHQRSQNSEMAVASFFRNISHGTQLAICIQKYIHVCISICKYIYTCIYMSIIYIKVTYLFFVFYEKKNITPWPLGWFFGRKARMRSRRHGITLRKVGCKIWKLAKTPYFFAAWCTFRLKQHQSKPQQFCFRAVQKQQDQIELWMDLRLT